MIFVKDVIFLSLTGVVAFLVVMLLEMLLWLSHVLVLGAFLYFCWWFTRLPVLQKDLIRERIYGFLGPVKSIFIWR
jgi:hypothetical protein